MAQEIKQIGQAATAAIQTRSASEAWAKPAWISAWSVAEHPVPPVPASQISAELFRCQEALEPAPHDLISNCLKRLMDVLSPPRSNADASDRVADWWGRNQEIYISAVADLPADLITMACRRLLKSAKFMPKPVEIREAVAEEFMDRSETRAKLTFARTRAKADVPKPSARDQRTPEDIAAAEETMRRVREALGRSSESAKDTSRPVGLNRDDEGSDTKTGRAA